VRTGVGGVGVAVVGTARGQAAGDTILAAVTVDAGVGLVGEVGVVRASGGCTSAVGSGASGGVAGTSCGVSSAVVFIGVSSVVCDMLSKKLTSVRVDTRISLVGDVRVVRTGVVGVIGLVVVTGHRVLDFVRDVST
jgi:hypothetical protein